MRSDDESDRIPAQKIGGQVDLSSSNQSKGVTTSVYDEFPCEEFKDMKISRSAVKNSQTATSTKKLNRGTTDTKTRTAGRGRGSRPKPCMATNSIFIAVGRS